MGRLIERLYGAPALLLGLTTLFWGMNAVISRLAVGEISPFQLVFLRWLLVSAALWALYGREVRAHWDIIRPRLGAIALMASLGFTGFNALFYIAGHHTSAVNIGILQGSIPIFVLLGAFLAHGARITGSQSVGVALTLIGVAVVATRGAPFELLGLSPNLGDLFMLLACSLYAFYTVKLQTRPAMPGRAFFTLMAPIAALSSAPLALGEALIAAPPAPTPLGWALALIVAIFPSCLAQLFFLRGVDLIGPGRAGVYVNLVPVFAALLAVAILGEAFEPFHAIALALVLGGIGLAQRKPRGG